MGFPAIIENETTFTHKIENVEIHFDGVRIYTGYLRIMNVSNVIRADFNIGLSKLADAVQNKSMQDMVDETINLTTRSVKGIVVQCDDSNFAKYAGLPVPAATHNLRVTINSTNYESTFDAFGLNVIAYSINISAFNVRAKVAKLQSGYENYFFNNVKNTKEFESLQAHLYIEDYNGFYTYSAVVIKNSDSTTVAASIFEASHTGPDISTYRIEDYTKKIMFARLECPDIYTGNDAFAGKANDIDESNSNETDIYNAPQILLDNKKEQKRWANTLIPFVYQKYFITQVEDSIGITITGSPLSNAIIEDIGICAMKTLDYWESVVYKPYGGSDLGWEVFVNSYLKTFNLKDYIPDVNFGIWLKSLRNMFGMYLFFEDDTDTLHFFWLQDIITGNSYDQWTSIAIEGIEMSANNYEGLTFPQNTDGISDYVEDEGKTTIYNESILLKQPVTDQKCQSPVFGSKSIRELFLSRINYSDFPQNSHLHMQWGTGSISGTIYNHWLDTIEFLKKTRPVKMKMKLSFADLLSLTEIGADGLPNIARKKRIKENNFLINSVDVQLTNQGIEPADVEFYLAE